jgi:hypothetical protein
MLRHLQQSFALYFIRGLARLVQVLLSLLAPSVAPLNHQSDGHLVFFVLHDLFAPLRSLQLVVKVGLREVLAFIKTCGPKIIKLFDRNFPLTVAGIIKHYKTYCNKKLTVLYCAA